MTDEHEEQKNEEAMQRIEEQAARQRVPGAFDIAFLSGMEMKRRVVANLVTITSAVAITFTIGLLVKRIWGIST